MSHVISRKAYLSYQVNKFDESERSFAHFSFTIYNSDKKRDVKRVSYYWQCHRPVAFFYLKVNVRASEVKWLDLHLHQWHVTWSSYDVIFVSYRGVITSMHFFSSLIFRIPDDYEYSPNAYNSPVRYHRNVILSVNQFGIIQENNSQVENSWYRRFSIHDTTVMLRLYVTTLRWSQVRWQHFAECVI